MGGKAAFLGTGNPVAANLYQSFGFQYLPGTKTMCRFTNTNGVKFEKEFILFPIKSDDRKKK